MLFQCWLASWAGKSYRTGTEINGHAKYFWLSGKFTLRCFFLHFLDRVPNKNGPLGWVLPQVTENPLWYKQREIYWLLQVKSPRI